MSIEKQRTPESAHEKIAPTAIGVAYRRALAEIPYAREIFAELEKESHEDLAHLERLKSPELAPIIEARYRLVSKLAQETGALQYLEVAAGYASRGLEFSRDPNIRYVEFDQLSVIRRKERMIGKIEPGRRNLSFMQGNALNLDALTDATELFDTGKPLTILNEGLLRYLTFEEKAKVAENIYSILDVFDGDWITPDITLRSVIAMENKKSPGQKEALATVAGMNVDDNAFESVAAAEIFFSDLGFSIEKHSFMEVMGDLVTPGKLGISEEGVREELQDPVVFVMRAV